MKFVKILTLTIAAAFAVFFSTACKDSPGDVVCKWSSAIADGDLETANECSTAKTQMLNGFIIAMLQEAKEENKEDFEKKMDAMKNAEVIREEIDGDTAKVWIKKPEGEESDEPITLVKVDGDWKVDVKKD